MKKIITLEFLKSLGEFQLWRTKMEITVRFM